MTLPRKGRIREVDENVEIILVGADVPAGIVALESCDSCVHCVPVDGADCCNSEGQDMTLLANEVLDSWLRNHEVRGSCWCPEYEAAFERKAEHDDRES